MTNGRRGHSAPPFVSIQETTLDSVEYLSLPGHLIRPPRIFVFRRCSRHPVLSYALVLLQFIADYSCLHSFVSKDRRLSILLAILPLSFLFHSLTQLRVVHLHATKLASSGSTNEEGTLDDRSRLNIRIKRGH